MIGNSKSAARDAMRKLTLDSGLGDRHNGDDLITVVICGDNEQGYNMAKSERLTITLGRDQRHQLATIAERRRTSTATVIRWAVDDYIKQTSRRPAKTNAIPGKKTVSGKPV